MKYFLGFVMTILVLVACEKKSDINPRDDKLVEIDTCFADSCYTCELNDASQFIYDKLILAFEDSCVACLEAILLDWHNQSKPETNIPDSLKDMYDVFKEFYSPWDLARISDSEFGDNIYQGISYYVIQSEIRYDNNFRTFGDHYYKVQNFLPTINNDTIRFLYLNSDYKSAINCFLGTEYVPIGFDNIMTPAYPDGKSYERYRFLNNFLLFFHGHWGNYWHLETHPEVETISFNETKDSAQVHFRLGYQGGEVILGKKEGKWIIVDHAMTWIE